MIPSRDVPPFTSSRDREVPFSSSREASYQPSASRDRSRDSPPFLSSRDAPYPPSRENLYPSLRDGPSFPSSRDLPFHSAKENPYPRSDLLDRRVPGPYHPRDFARPPPRRFDYNQEFRSHSPRPVVDRRHPQQYTSLMSNFTMNKNGGSGNEKEGDGVKTELVDVSGKRYDVDSSSSPHKKNRDGDGKAEEYTQDKTFEKEHQSPKPTPAESSDESNDDSNDEFDQDDIEEQIERVDTEIAKNERLLNMIKAQEASKHAEDVAELLESPAATEMDFKPKLSVRNTESMPEEELIKKILGENRSNALDLRHRDAERNSELPNASMLDQSLLFKQITINPRMRSVLVDKIRAKKAAARHHVSLLVEQQEKIYEKWLVRVKKLDLAASRKAAEMLAPKALVDDHHRTSRRTGIADGVVRSEAEWENAMQILGITSSEQLARIEERSAKEPDMILDRTYSFAETNNLVLDPVADLMAFNNRMELKWSEHEKDDFRRNLLIFDKNFHKLSSFLPHKTTQECVQYFYREKVNLGFKQLIRRGIQGPGRGRRRKDKIDIGPIPPDYITYILDPDDEVVRYRRMWEEELNEEMFLLNDSEQVQQAEQEAVETPFSLNDFPGWTQDDLNKVLSGVEMHGRDFALISDLTDGKPAAECKLVYKTYRRKVEGKGMTGPGRKPKKRGPKPKVSPLPPQSPNSKIEDVQVDDSVQENGDDKKRKNDEEDLIEKKKRKLKEKEEIDPLNPQESRKTISYWSVVERADFLRNYTTHGKNWEAISKVLGTKSIIQVRNYYHNSRQKLKLDDIVIEDGGKLPKQRRNINSISVLNDAVRMVRTNSITSEQAGWPTSSDLKMSSPSNEQIKSIESTLPHPMSVLAPLNRPGAPISAPGDNQHPSNYSDINSFRAASSYIDQMRISQQASLLLRAASNASHNTSATRPFRTTTHISDSSNPPLDTESSHLPMSVEVASNRDLEVEEGEVMQPIHEFIEYAPAPLKFANFDQIEHSLTDVNIDVGGIRNEPEEAKDVTTDIPVYIPALPETVVKVETNSFVESLFNFSREAIVAEAIEVHVIANPNVLTISDVNIFTENAFTAADASVKAEALENVVVVAVENPGPMAVVPTSSDIQDPEPQPTI